MSEGMHEDATPYDHRLAGPGDTGWDYKKDFLAAVNDYRSWVDQEEWTLWTAVFLVNGFDPIDSHLPSLGNVPVAPEIKRWSQIYVAVPSHIGITQVARLVVRHQAKGFLIASHRPSTGHSRLLSLLDYRVRPKEFTRWFVEQNDKGEFQVTGLNLPAPLAERLEQSEHGGKAMESEEDQGKRATSHPTAFISYSWDNEKHKKWVRALAARLRHDAVDAKLDQWETLPGDQLPQFMESAVSQNQFVLIICTPRYKERSDSRKGGVGYEGDIMTGEVLTTRNQRKFIPILRRGTWIEAAPVSLVAKRYVDLSEDPYSESEYEDLLTTLLGTREVAPPVGQSPGTDATQLMGAIPFFSYMKLFRETKVLITDLWRSEKKRVPLSLYTGSEDPGEKLAFQEDLEELVDKHKWIVVEGEEAVLTEQGREAVRSFIDIVIPRWQSYHGP